MKTLVVYMPLSWPNLSSRVFRSFVDLISPEVRKELADKFDVQVKTMISDTFPLDRNRNEAVDLATSNKYEADYIFFADADNIWPKNTLVSLMSNISNEFPSVSGLYWRKGAPHVCVQGHYSGWEKHELKRKVIEQMGFIDKDGNQLLYYKPLKDFDTKQPIDVAGCGCLLVKAEIFKNLSLPYFGYFNAYSLGGDFTITHVSEEMLLFAKFKKAGIKTLVVPEVRCGHITEKVIGCSEEN